METLEILRAYPNSYDDPKPVSFDRNADTQKAQRKTITAFSDEM